MFTNLNNITEIKDFINEIKGILQWKYQILLIELVQIILKK
jgi:hypothetical protein